MHMKISKMDENQEKKHNETIFLLNNTNKDIEPQIMRMKTNLKLQN